MSNYILLLKNKVLLDFFKHSTLIEDNDYEYIYLEVSIEDEALAILKEIQAIFCHSIHRTLYAGFDILLI